MRDLYLLADIPPYLRDNLLGIVQIHAVKSSPTPQKMINKSTERQRLKFLEAKVADWWESLVIVYILVVVIGCLRAAGQLLANHGLIFFIDSSFK